MVFYDAALNTGICQEIDRICGSSNATYDIQSKTARVNMALDRFVSLALLYDDNWQYDDSNNTDFPIGVANLVSGQQDYSFPSELLTVTKVLVMDTNGLWKQLDLVNREQIQSKPIFELAPNNSGVPWRYAIFANSILLDAIPNYNSALGLKVIFQRNANRFVYTDTTLEPGIPSLFHSYLARYAALPFLIEKRLSQKNDVAQQVIIDEQAICDFMSNRNDTQPKRMLPKWRSSR